MFKPTIALAFLCTGIIALSGAARADTQSSPSSSSHSQSNTVVDWNKMLLTIVRTPGAQPATVHSTRNFAIMHAAIYDAVNSIDRTHEPYAIAITLASRTASEDAAAAAAAHEVLESLYPNFQNTLDIQLAASLASIADGADKAEGIRIGRAVAEAILAMRADDGSSAPPIPFVFDTVPGHYQSTPPNFPKQPQLTNWPNVTPFTLQRANQFRPGPPPALESDAYANALNEVKSVGIANSTAATADQALTGRFWNGAIQNYWNEIAQTTVLMRGLTVAQSARLFALVNFAFADSAIAFFDAKYTYRFWRPVTAIRAADIDNNPQTQADPNWLPEVGNTPPDPSYPGAHAVISSAGAFVLSTFFRTNRFDFNVTSEVLPGVTRHFDSFSDAKTEASLSRIFAGVHFRTDEVTGEQLGRAIADFVTDRFLTPRREDRDDDREDKRRER